MPGNRPNVQHIFDDEAPETGDERAHVGVWCLACTGIHLVNRKTSRLVSASAAREENGWDECSQDDCPMLPKPRRPVAIKSHGLDTPTREPSPSPARCVPREEHK
jgi:hypothetical protein